MNARRADVDLSDEQIARNARAGMRWAPHSEIRAMAREIQRRRSTDLADRGALWWAVHRRCHIATDYSEGVELEWVEFNGQEVESPVELLMILRNITGKADP